ncbi:P-loop containing nucleoside triphosphate hydrolases superfamily protein [Rhynchospora pubera]|uniref:P-loop containing nucleoside triphosphate hydrolases superfamily protein n=1 Tax=Rhynchospora pubera TaxID=906938 RepID=A0AAV8BS26_9POAL|nr:P-loop containing nucleoside triphosphate hydrolases superfamily protein [Rhynchospora pubera]
MKEHWTSLASLMGVLAFLTSILHTLFPPELRLVFLGLIRRLTRNILSSYAYFDITEIDGVSTNELYSAVQLYLSKSAAISAGCGTRLSLTRPVNSSAFTYTLSNNDRVDDCFQGKPVVWEHVVVPRQNGGSFSWRPLPDEKRGFTLRIRKKDRAALLPKYLDHIMETAAEIRRRSQDRLLYTNTRGGGMDPRGHPWESVPFKHPSTFDTLAMDPTRKEEIMADLCAFANGKLFYEKAGRAWKRGYLLYGPPGTGKSSMIAAMANFLRYDVYDLELTEVHTNSELRKLLMKTTSKSIIVIEDIDCSLNLSNRNPARKKPIPFNEPPVPEMRPNAVGMDDALTKSITLSGLLNFTDGLWSCCGNERIFVFTTNHIEKLDPALLRSGRMDMHIFLSYCSFPALKILMRNYLGIEEHEFDNGILSDLEEAIGEAEITPADVSEILIKNRCLKKCEAVIKSLEALKCRSNKSKVIGNVAVKTKGSEEGEEEEEQEKRALESPKEAKGTMVGCIGKEEKGE